MSKGFKTLGLLLKEDLEFERTAVKTYSGFVERIEDVRIKELFKSLADDELGHVAGLTEILNNLNIAKSEVKFYCPRCGWSLSFGKSPSMKDKVKCPMCRTIFRLGDKNGDYILEAIKKE
jgi:rubrerythrin